MCTQTDYVRHKKTPGLFFRSTHYHDPNVITLYDNPRQKTKTESSDSLRLTKRKTIVPIDQRLPYVFSQSDILKVSEFKEIDTGRQKFVLYICTWSIFYTLLLLSLPIERTQRVHTVCLLSTQNNDWNRQFDYKHITKRSRITDSGQRLITYFLVNLSKHGLGSQP